MSEQKKVECFYCKGEAFNEEHKGVAYYRAQLPSGKWDSVPICITCLKEKQPRFRDDNK
jgi:hypothetical protein